MSRRLVASLVPVLAAAALVGPLGGTSYASTCVTVAEPPHLILGEDGIHASGTFSCTDPSTNMTVTACIEEQGGGWLVNDGVWYTDGCATVTTPEATDRVTVKVAVPMMVYSTTLRTVVTATDDAGDQGAAKSVPALWFNCACYVG